MALGFFICMASKQPKEFGGSEPTGMGIHHCRLMHIYNIAFIALKGYILKHIPALYLIGQLTV